MDSLHLTGAEAPVPRDSAQDYCVEHVFRCTGLVPKDHEYWVFAGLCQQIPRIHGNKSVLISRIRGGELQERDGKPWLRLGPGYGSEFSVRGLSYEELQSLRWLRVHEQVLGLELPYARYPEATSGSVQANMVLLRGLVKVEEFSAELTRQLTGRVGPGDWTFELSPHPRTILLPKRDDSLMPGRVNPLIRDTRHVGWGVRIRGLTPEQQLTLLQRGLGASGRFGCGFFFPI